MNSTNFKMHGCHGCHGGFQSGSGCQSAGSGKINCTVVGPFRAIDAACIIPPANKGTIIPFSSGLVPAVLTSIAGGLVGTTSLVGFGTSIPGVTILGNTIDLTSLLNEAFTVPRAGNLTAISASFSVAAAVAVAGTITVKAQVYRAPAGSNIYTATGATVDLAPSLVGPLAIGAITFGSASIPAVPVAVGDNLVMVFSITATGLTLINAVTGNASAGLTIE
ncbi:exosporium glycoprotein BclB-related protein [Sporosarcina limicola]|uniref:BclB C-terminal domain-containing protein n=1 Tax=Sporosarcina limicola TaxID=34101 RepID=A0A927MSY4_9BACL|nr:exosporium glycoprotein BclB-related protein [Sporosarcina limicola]MBE1556781.1 BclB C-terminal domain-containing protein [Sporosarcina limicola]